MNARVEAVEDRTDEDAAWALARALRHPRPELGLRAVCEALVSERPGAVAAVVRRRGRERCLATASRGPWDAGLPGRILGRRCSFWSDLQQGRAVHHGPVHAVPLFLEGALDGALVLAGAEPAPPCLHLAAGVAEALLARALGARTLRATRLALLRARHELRVRREAELRQRSRAAHDLKAPLTALMGYLDMLKRGLGGPLTPGLSRYVELMSQAVARERCIIDEQVCPRANLAAPPR